MKEAMFYESLDGAKVQCRLCPNNCVVLEGMRGKCGVRENRKGKLCTLVHGLPCTVGVDPIEKKPLFHFFPGTQTYSVATVGCNLKCKFCQNWQISQEKIENTRNFEMSPEQVVENAIVNDCKSISYTYVEPTIFYEFIIDTAKLAREKGLKNVVVTNGFINPEPLKELYKYIDAANIDLKAFSDGFYVKYCEAKLEPVLESIKNIHKMGVFIELTNLIIPGLNDSMDKIKNMCDWIVKELGVDVPLHFSRFFPHHELKHIAPTPIESLKKAEEIAKGAGLKNVYLGNV